MADKIIIEFLSQTEEVDTATKAVEKLGEAGNKEAANFNKVNTDAVKSMKEREKAITQTGTSLSKFTEAVKNTEKATAGAFGTKTLKEFQTAISKTLKETVDGFKLSDAQARKFFKNIQDEAKKGLELGGSEQEMLEYTASLNAATEALGEMGEESENAEGKTLSFRQRLKELKNELQQLEEQGLDNTDRFREMAIEAAQLEDQIGDTNARIRAMASDTFAFDATISGIQGVASAFQVGQGAIALFGAENQELNEALVKLNAIMAVTQGLQQVRNTLEAQSAISIAITNAQQKLALVQTSLQTAAESRFIVVRGAAAVAQRVLNAVMAANPVGILITAITALAGILVYFSGKADDATDSQKAFNASLEEGSRINDELLNGIKNYGSLREAELKKQNATSSQLRANDLQNLKDQLKQNDDFLNANRPASDFANEQLRKYAAGVIDLDDKLVDEYKKTVKSIEGIVKTSIDTKNDIERATIDDEKETFNERLKNNTAFYQNRLNLTKEASRAELLAQVDLIRAKEKEELQSAGHLSNEALAIQSAADKEVAKVRQQIRLFDINTAISNNEALLAKSKEGSAQELAFKINAIKLGARAEVEQANGNAAKIKEINAKAAREEYELKKAYNEKIVDDELNARTASANSQLAQLNLQGARASTQQLYEAKVQQLELQSEAEINAIQRSIDTEENKRARILEVYDRELADKVQLERDKISAEISSNQAYQSALDQLQESRLSRGLQNTRITLTQRENLENALYDQQQKALDNSLDADQRRYDAGLISLEEFETKKLQILDQKEAIQTQKAIDAETRRQNALNLIKTSAQTVFGNINSIFAERNLANIDKEIAKVQELKEKKIISEEEAQQRTTNLRRQSAKQEKDMALFSAAVSQSLAIMAVLKDPTLIGPLRPLAIASAVAAALSQIAAIAAKPLPQLYLGTRSAAEGLYRTGEVGMELMWHKDTGFNMLGKKGEEINYIPQGARVWNALETSNMMKSMFNSQDFPTMATLPKNKQVFNIQYADHLDYDKMGKAFAKHVGKIESIPGLNLHIDRWGIHAIIKEGIDEMEFLNDKYTYKSK